MHSQAHGVVPFALKTAGSSAPATASRRRRRCVSDWTPNRCRHRHRHRQASRSEIAVGCWRRRASCACVRMQMKRVRRCGFCVWRGCRTSDPKLWHTENKHWCGRTRYMYHAESKPVATICCDRVELRNVWRYQLSKAENVKTTKKRCAIS